MKDLKPQSSPLNPLDSPGFPGFPATFVMHNGLHLVRQQQLRAAFSQKVISGLCTRVAFWLTARRPPNPNPQPQPHSHPHPHPQYPCRSDIFIGLPIS
ncbi:GM19462 [Drosophila sechellia]|uniref:GM19462 n=1 Tax=Drosophila sechellia TaxID=7238 RepID=B4IQD2_DROSE|nr:GM19462 [Drosophila sechellia]